MDLVRPIIIPSPYSGAPCKPRVTTREDGDKIITEAQWVCFTTGKLFRRGVVSIEDKKQN